MPKFTLISENEYPVIGGDSKTTVEGQPITIQNAVDLFERFLRGSGFEFDGSISINNITEPRENNCCGGCGSDEIFTTFGDVNLDISNYGAAQPYYGYDEYSGLSFPAGIDTITLTSHDSSNDYPEIQINLEEEKPDRKSTRLNSSHT